MARVRKVLERYSKRPPLIDFHSGWRASATVEYLGLWAFVDSLWLGEGYAYDTRSPTSWLIEMSGLAFGMFSDMMGRGNPWKGMLFGSTGRFGCTNPSPMWRAWDALRINQTDMVGFWEPRPPVTLLTEADAGGPGRANRTSKRARRRLSDESFLVTSFVAPGMRTIVALAHWDQRVPLRPVWLQPKWAKLQLDPKRVRRVRAPDIEGFQTRGEWRLDEPIAVPPARGLLLVLEES